MIKHHLQFYATQFSTAELNGVFYRTPTVEAVRGWRDGTPDDFVFAWKASKFITHWKRLTEKSRNSLALMESRLRILGQGRAGAVPVAAAIQRRTASGLPAFLSCFEPKRRYAFEFRHPSWYERRCLRICCAKTTSHYAFPTITMRRRRGMSPPHSSMCAATGRAGDITAAIPTRRCMNGPARSRAGSGSGRDVYVYFDNDQKSAAPFDALRLMAVLRR